MKLAILGMAASVLWAQPEGRLDLRVRDDFFAGMFGDRARLERGMTVTEELLRKNPRNAQALVWHGSGLLTRASNAYADGQSQIGDRQWKQGLKELDRARELAPGDLGVLIGRSAILIGIAQSGFDPTDPQGRALLTTAVRDYETVLERQSGYLAKLSEHSRCELLFGLAAGWNRLDEISKTRGYLERIVEHCAGSPYEAEARRYLEKSPMPVIDHNCIGCHVSKK
jgi:hypothetical protein